MGRANREIFLEHNFYHIYNRGNNRRLIFRDKEDKTYFMEKLFEYFKKSDNKIIATCIMRNHFHILIEAGPNNDISKLMHRLCSSYSHFYGWKYSHVGHIFQGRYKSKRIETEIGILNVLKYIQENPVKKGYSEKPEDYTWLRVMGTGSDGDRHQT